MEKLYYEVPSIERKNEAIEYINEHYEYKSDINGSGGLHRYLNNYEGWLDKLEKDYTMTPSEERVPARTYIGYGIRPTERGKGYNKVNLYLGLKVCDEYGIETVFMDADLDNPASWKTMEALGGVRVKEYYNEDEKCMVVDYNIDVKNALEKYKEIYEPYVSNGKVK